MSKWYDADFRGRRKELLVELMGGKCNRCGAVDVPLEFDHLDPTTKKFSISTKLEKHWRMVLKEAIKCQLLCSACHKHKTKIDFKKGLIKTYNGTGGSLECGSASKYSNSGCRCGKCTSAWAAYIRGRRKRLKVIV